MRALAATSVCETKATCCSLPMALLTLAKSNSRSESTIEVVWKMQEIELPPHCPCVGKSEGHDPGLVHHGLLNAMCNLM
ncbi:hypothetical protein E2C01_089237 [Portunus trituberculatus]|uniref:Uncharacterized protein n=1 Tax=Portunus trituberculatus TaxID=210409 RepID=A0A5B7JHL3_PORTR|nr:hypothetical protein [Portunus trituberculatus]